MSCNTCEPAADTSFTTSQPISTCKSYDSRGSNKSSIDAAKDIYKKSKYIQKRTPSIASTASTVKRSMLSARLLRKKNFHNQLVEAEQKIGFLKKENRVLKTIHQRQDAALSKYESAGARLPTLLHIHMEELNMLEDKCRKLQTENRELEDKIKNKEAAIIYLGDQNDHFANLNMQKKLEDLDILFEKISFAETVLRDKANEQKQLFKLLDTELKLYKQKLRNASNKTKASCNKFKEAVTEITDTTKPNQAVKKFNISSDSATSKRWPQKLSVDRKGLPTEQANSGNSCDSNGNGNCDGNGLRSRTAPLKPVRKAAQENLEKVNSQADIVSKSSSKSEEEAYKMQTRIEPTTHDLKSEADDIFDKLDPVIYSSMDEEANSGTLLST